MRKGAPEQDEDCAICPMMEALEHKAAAVEASVPQSPALSPAQLGSTSWSFLHSLAAYYPERPSPEQQSAASAFFSALGVLYPCGYCAEDFREQSANNPLRAESRESLSVWLCEQHNAVNSKLGKPEFRCSIDALDRRWRREKH